jgi:hypothetical protein
VDEFTKILYDHPEVSGRRVGEKLVISSDPSLEFDYDRIPNNLVFKDTGTIYFNNLQSIPNGTIFENTGNLYLMHVISVNPGVIFKNTGQVYLLSLGTLSPGVIFEGTKDVHLKDLSLGGIGFTTKGWDLEIKGFEKIRLFNHMVQIGFFKK